MTLDRDFLEALQQYMNEQRNASHSVLHHLSDLGKPL